MIAHRVAAPVLEHVGARGVVAGVVKTAAYVELDGFVVAVTARGVPLMPNGLALTGRPEKWPLRGTPVHLTAGGLRGQGWGVAWSDVWDPSVPRANGVDSERVRRRGEAILRGAPPTPEGLAAAGVEIAASDGVGALLRALRTGEPPDAHALLGLGSGLTPEGDDLLAGAAAAVAALEPWDADTRAAWLAAAAPPDTRARTTALSATLLELAAQGRAIEPLHALLDLHSERWAPALGRLERLGHSTGRCYAAAVGAAAVLASRR
jgi:hypothetical protein